MGYSGLFASICFDPVRLQLSLVFYGMSVAWASSFNGVMGYTPGVLQKIIMEP